MSIRIISCSYASTSWSANVSSWSSVSNELYWAASFSIRSRVISSVSPPSHHTPLKHFITVIYRLNKRKSSSPPVTSNAVVSSEPAFDTDIELSESKVVVLSRPRSPQRSYSQYSQQSYGQMINSRFGDFESHIVPDLPNGFQVKVWSICNLCKGFRLLILDCSGRCSTGSRSCVIYAPHCPRLWGFSRAVSRRTDGIINEPS